MFAIWRLWRRVGGWRAIVAQVLLAWRLVRDHRVPLLPKLILPATLIYYFSPLNLLFEWIPFVGQIDDVGVALIALGAFLKACPKSLVAEHASRLEEEMLRDERFERMGHVGRYARPTFRQWAREPAAPDRPAPGAGGGPEIEAPRKAA
jgi:uncharacterized membrane protein YkvA (DUF1232 family)